jgi:hypothetical protein
MRSPKYDLREWPLLLAPEKSNNGYSLSFPVLNPHLNGKYFFACITEVVPGDESADISNL